MTSFGVLQIRKSYTLKCRTSGPDLLNPDQPITRTYVVLCINYLELPSSSNCIFIMAGRQKDMPTKGVKNSFTPQKNILKEIQRLPTKEASILLQFIELPCCFFYLILVVFLMCIFFLHGGQFWNKTLQARFRNFLHTR